MKYCPKCKEQRPESDSYCSECFSRLQYLPHRTSRVSVESSPKDREVEAPMECPICGTNNPDGQEKCIECLEPLSKVGEPRFAEGQDGFEQRSPPRARSPILAPEDLPSPAMRRTKVPDRPWLEATPPETLGPIIEDSEGSMGWPTQAARVRPAQAVPDEEYGEIVTDIRQYLAEGFDMFGLVGAAGSGKTHSLKALSTLLSHLGMDSRNTENSGRGQTFSAKTGTHTYFGSKGQKWVFADIGGELYSCLNRNDWARYRSNEIGQLSQCKGLFMYLHLNRSHFAKRTDDFRYLARDYENVVGQQREAQEELEFFGRFLLFLRALEVEHGDVERVIARCQRSSSLEGGLLEYRAIAPLLEIPVMFFFTKADLHEEEEMEVANGLYMRPRNLPMSTAAFVARYLPTLFVSLVTQVRSFKFDFIQSYEVRDSGRREGGKPVMLPTWEDRGESLSMGLLSGLEFILHNKPTYARPWWHRPGIDTRTCLKLHRFLHPRQWRGVRFSI